MSEQGARFGNIDVNRWITAQIYFEDIASGIMGL